MEKEKGNICFLEDQKDSESFFDGWFFDQKTAHSIDRSELYAFCSICNLHLARKIAPLLFSEKNEISIPQIERVESILQKYHVDLLPYGEELIDRIIHIKQSIQFLKGSKEAQNLIKRISKPYANKRAERIICDTLELNYDHQISDLDSKTAVLVALVTKIRQSLGSCFATAPAILLQEEYPLQFLQDIEMLFSTGRLRKTVRGVEHTVPMSASWGGGELKKNISYTVRFEENSIPIIENRTLSPLLIRAFQIVNNHSYSEEEILAILFSENKSCPESINYTFSYDMIVEKVCDNLFSDNPLKKKEAGAFVKRYLKMQGECALLKSWEFTLASYAEVKFELCRWNFYSSLGVNWDDEDGIGQVLYQIAHQTVQETNEEIDEMQKKCDAMNTEIAYLEQRSRNATTEQDLAWITMEHRSRKTEQYHLQELADIMKRKAEKIAGIHQFLIDKYDLLLQEYFQEVYDPDLHDVDVGPYDDSPAGFRLIYKYGRSNPSLWSPIYSLKEYIEALSSFFSLTEQELIFDPYLKDIEKEFRFIITRLIIHIQSPSFQESALQRTLSAHGLPKVKNILENISHIEKKPWVFTSGGSMESLVSSYFRLEEPVESQARWVENETELFSFFIDTTRLSCNRQKKGVFFQKSPSLLPSLLMHSPTHAFRLLPSKPLFYEAWTSEMYSYSWIYNKVRDPSQEMLKRSIISPDLISRAIEDIVDLFPKEIQKRAKELFQIEIPPFLRVFEFANSVKEVCRKDVQLRGFSSFLSQSGAFEEKIYSSFPYQGYQEAFSLLEEAIRYITQNIDFESREERITESISLIRDRMRKPVFSSSEIYFHLTTALLHIFGLRNGKSQLIIQLALSFLRKKGALFPEPVIVADSNWVKEYFAFLVSPVTSQIEFWTVSFLGIKGRPIHHWKKWFNGSDQSKKWGIYVNSDQYKIV